MSEVPLYTLHPKEGVVSFERDSPVQGWRARRAFKLSYNYNMAYNYSSEESLQNGHF